MKKFFCVLLIFCISICSLSAFATEYESITDLIEDVNEILDDSNTTEVENYEENYENIVASELDNWDSLQGYEINQILVLNEINAAVQNLAGSSLFNVNSAQVEYFKTYLIAHPFYDYVVTYDGSYDYNLYYGYKLNNGIADRIHIYRYNTSGYNYEYRIEFSEGVNVPSSNVYINSREGSQFGEVQTAKFETVVMLAFAVMLLLWFFSRVIFR